MADLVLATVNVRTFNRKRPLVENAVVSENIHVLSLTETRVKPRFPLRVLNYVVYRHDRYVPPARAEGGSALAIHPDIPSSRHDLPPEFAHLQCAAAIITTRRGPVHVFSLYVPPQDRLSDDFLLYISTLPRAVLLGDLNARHTIYGDHATNVNGRILADGILTYDLYRIPNTQPTFFGHQGSSIIDHIVVTDSISHHFPEDAFIGTTVTSDHVPLVVSSTLTDPPPPRPTSIVIRDWKNARWDLFQDRVSNSLDPDTPLADITQIDDSVRLLMDSISQAIDAAVPTKAVPLNKTRLPPHVLELIRDKRRLYRQYIRTRDPGIKTQWNRLNALVRLRVSQHRERAWTSSLEGLDYRHGARFWDQFRLLTGQKRQQRSHLSAHGQTFSDDESKARLFADTLARHSHIPDTPPFNHDHIRDTIDNIRNRPDLLPSPQVPPVNPFDHESLADFETVDTIAAIRRGRNSAPGPDTITQRALRHLPDSVYDLLTKICNACLRSGHFPSLWK